MNFSSIAYKLLLLLSITVFGSLLINSFLHYQSVKNEHLKKFYEQSNIDTTVVINKLQDYKERLLTQAQVFAHDEVIINGMNLISNYQDRENYQAILFDEEKKKMLQHLLTQTNSTESLSFLLLDEKREPILIDHQHEGQMLQGIYTYENGALRFKSSYNSLTQDPPAIEIDKRALQNRTSLHISNNQLLIIGYVEVYLEGKIVGYIQIMKCFEEKNLPLLVGDSALRVMFLGEGLSLGATQNDNIQLIKTNAHPLDTNDSFIEGEKHFYHAHYMTLEDGKRLYVAVAIDRLELDTKRWDLQKQLIISLIISLIFAFGVGLLLIRNQLIPPLEQIMDGIQSLKEKNFKAIEIKSSDEFAVIAKEFNLLVAALEKSFNDLENTNSLLINLIDSVPIRVFWKNNKGIYLGANRLFIQDANLSSREEIVGKSDFDLPWANTEAEGYIKDDRETIETRESKLNIFETQTTPDGRVLYLNTSKVPLFDEKGDVYGVLGLYEDITEKRLAQKKIKEHEAQMIQRSRLMQMGEMIHNIAHQWRQPINTIGLLFSKLGIAKEHGKLSDEMLDQSILRGEKLVQQMSQTIEDFRNFFKPDKIKKEFIIQESIKDALSLVDAALQDAHILIKTQFCSNGVNIYGYPNEVTQVLLNIFSNAKDAIVDNKISNGIITIKCECDKSEVCVTIQDNGGGIPEDVLSKIFDPYFTTKEQGQGTGIGLYMSKQIIETNMGGRIYAQNHKDGALFFIHLPLEKNDIKKDS